MSIWTGDRYIQVQKGQVYHHVGACRAWYQKTPGPGQPKEIPVREQGEERQSYKQNQNKDPAKGSC